MDKFRIKKVQEKIRFPREPSYWNLLQNPLHKSASSDDELLGRQGVSEGSFTPFFGAASLFSCGRYLALLAQFLGIGLSP
jgi:hypothetical protein